MKKLVIQESKWIHGNPGGSTLLDDNGNMCCLGFYGKSLGASDQKLSNLGTPAAVLHTPWHPKLIDSFFNGNSKFGQHIIFLNDVPETQESLDYCVNYGFYIPGKVKAVPLAFKKMRLIEVFAEMDIQLEFVL